MRFSGRRIAVHEAAGLARSMLGFGGLQLLSLVAPFVVLPVLSRTLAASGWASLATGQAIGTVGSVAVAFGWGLSGPVAVARSRSATERAQLYRDSIVMRAILFGVLGPACGLLAALLTSGPTQVLAAWVALASAGSGLSAGWFFIGTGEPLKIAWLDTVPRLALMLIASWLVWESGSALWYAAAVSIAVVFTAGASAILILRDLPSGRIGISVRASWREMRSSVRHQVHLAITDTLGSLYASAPVIIGAVVLLPTALSDVASADKIYRLSLISIVVLGNSFQSWAFSPETAEGTGRRQRLGVTAFAILGVLGCGALGWLGSGLTQWLFGSDVAASSAVVNGYALSFVAVSIGTAMIRMLLVPAGRQSSVLLSTVVGFGLGVPLMAAFGWLAGAPGVTLGLAISEMTVTLIQCAAVYRAWRRAGHADVAAGLG